MAMTAAGAALTEAHRITQARISASTVARMMTVWPLLDPTSLDATVARWLAAAMPIIQSQYTVSASLAAAYLQQFRTLELGRDAPRIPTPPVPPLDAVTTRSALIIEGPVKIKNAMSAGVALGSAVSTAASGAASVASLYAMSGGRTLETTFAASDPRAVGVRRVTSPGCCAFCAMLAARSVDGMSSDATRSGMTAFKVHKGCHCRSETAYRGGSRDATRQAKEFHALYRETADNRNGAFSDTKNPLLNAFRTALKEQRAGV